MGWFDNEQGADKPNAPPRKVAPRVSVENAGAAPEVGSTLGRQVHVDGTIVCGEDLTILGKVEGTIRAKGTLVIAKEADVRATIDGQRVIVHGKVDGNVHGAEKVVLGATAALTGNIEAPALEMTEGAFLKGSVEMRPAAEEPEQVDGSLAAAAAPSAARAEPAKQRSGAAERASTGDGETAPEARAKAAVAGESKPVRAGSRGREAGKAAS